MDTPIDGVQSPVSPVAIARLPLWTSVTGVIFFVGTAMPFGRLIWEETVWTWERGPQMVGFSLAHGSGALLLLSPVLLTAWTAIVIALTIWNMIRKKQVSRKRWAALGLILSILVLGSMPEGFWQRAFIKRMAASPRAGDVLLYAASVKRRYR